MSTSQDFRNNLASAVIHHTNYTSFMGSGNSAFQVISVPASSTDTITSSTRNEIEEVSSAHQTGSNDCVNYPHLFNLSQSHLSQFNESFFPNESFQNRNKTNAIDQLFLQSPEMIPYCSSPLNISTANPSGVDNKKLIENSFYNSKNEYSTQIVNYRGNSSSFIPDQPTKRNQEIIFSNSTPGFNGEKQLCDICGDISAGYHCSAFVCEACKKFFVRSSKADNFVKYTCPKTNNCEINKDTRTHCQKCRFLKCLSVGMMLPGAVVIPTTDISVIPCRVCGASSSGFHFGAITCEGCKGFFRRTINERDNQRYTCRNGGNCPVTTSTRNNCKSCRYNRCLAVGMSKEGSRIGRQPNSVKHMCAKEIEQIRAVSNKKQMSSCSNEMYSTNKDRSEQLQNLGKVFSCERYSNSIFNDKDPTSSQHNYSIESMAPNITINHVSVDCKPQIHSNRNFKRSLDASDELQPEDLYTIDDSDHKRSIMTYTNVMLRQDSKVETCNNSYLDYLTESSTNILTGYKQLFLNAAASSLMVTASSSTSGSPYSSSDQSTIKVKNDLPQSRDLVDLFVPTNSNNIPTNLTQNKNFAENLLIKSRSTFNFPSEVSTNNELCLVNDPMNEMYSNECEVSAQSVISPLSVTDYDSSLKINFDPNMPLEQFTSLVVNAAKHLCNCRRRIPTSSPLELGASLQVIWLQMMSHFESHAYQVIYFARTMPGFRELSRSDMKGLVQESMYPIVLIQLSPDYNSITKEINYFNFTKMELDAILQEFPIMKDIVKHLVTIGSRLAPLNLTEIERSLLCALILVRPTEIKLDGLEKVECIFKHCNEALKKVSDAHRYESFMKITEELRLMNVLHKKIINSIRNEHPELFFPDLYVQMFKLDHPE